MDAHEARRLYAYTEWANERMLAAAGELSDEQFGRAIVSSFPSVRDTLGHIAASEWVWLQRWLGESPLAPPAWTNSPSLSQLADEMRAIAARRTAYLAALENAAIEATIHYRNIKGEPFAMPLRELLVHCANHSTYHRGQVVTMLRQLGVAPASTDYSQFIWTSVVRQS